MTVCAALPPAANASARGRRAAILARPLSELTGFNLAVDCLAASCGGERTFAVADLASFYGGIARWVMYSGTARLSAASHQPVPARRECVAGDGGYVGCSGPARGRGGRRRGSEWRDHEENRRIAISGQQYGGRAVSIHRLTHWLMPRTVYIAIA